MAKPRYTKMDRRIACFGDTPKVRNLKITNADRLRANWQFYDYLFWAIGGGIYICVIAHFMQHPPQ